MNNQPAELDDIRSYDYYLPEKLIAQHPAEPRESARLLTVNRREQKLADWHISDLPRFFQRGDLIVINNTKVFKARLQGKLPSGAPVELFLMRPAHHNAWMAIARPGKKFIPGKIIHIGEDFSATVTQKLEDGTVTIEFPDPPDKIIQHTQKFGHVPVPPYIKNEPDLALYQTSYAKVTGSVAAPTAGFHLTRAIRRKLMGFGVEFAEITLHIGIGTFRPVKSQTVSGHVMHPEWVSVPEKTAVAVNRAKKEGRRVIAIGTTTVRTLEGIAAMHDGKLISFRGDINLFITPGYCFRIVDAMLTNFHLPKSTLIILVTAFAGRNLTMKAYRRAVRKKYRFFSFGDGMLIL